MVFSGVFGFAFTTRRACSVEQIRSYDTLVELESSDWVTELLSRWPDFLERPVVHHYRIYFDDVGCYEIAATHFELSSTRLPIAPALAQSFCGSVTWRCPTIGSTYPK